ncbi:hypothetical protein ACFSM5_13270 [Lacibacterium aquatile]|uniref:PAS domain-containing protein n=1 Tax=Lacibacterium aquatile TaxID=1168082 RepID=A0ABW5DV67_9PROT
MPSLILSRETAYQAGEDSLSTAKLLAFALSRADILVEIDQEVTIVSLHGSLRQILGEEVENFIGQPLRAILRPGSDADCAEIAIACKGGRRLSERLITLQSGRPATWAGTCIPEAPGRMYLSMALVERRKHPR